MPLIPVNLVDASGHKGKGLGLGSILGGVAGAIVGGVAGGPGGAVSGAGTGASLGGMIGNQIDPSTAGVETQNTSISQAGAPEKTVPIQRFENHPEVQLANLQTARDALKSESSISPQDAKLMDNDFATVQELIMKRLKT
jgi:phage tail tape-measure protein